MWEVLPFKMVRASVAKYALMMARDGVSEQKRPAYVIV
jgi:hypothetical protein